MTSSLADLHHKRILLGVTGGIAAYKAAEITRRLRQAGAEVRVAMTPAACRFVQPLTFEALSGHPVAHDMFMPGAESAMGHIQLSRWADAILVAPASADFMARISLGLADDLLATLCLAAEVPLFLAPAMNRAMWLHPATRSHAAALAGRGVALLGPDEGDQACGETGPGRMREPARLVLDLADALAAGGLLSGLRVLISAGPTREPIDPVRFIGNRSSGKMGYALAAAARRAGADVTLISGPVALDAPAGVETVRVETAAEMHEAVMARTDRTDIYIGTAAVADYTPARVADAKIKKHADRLELTLSRTRDILRSIAALPDKPFVVGFAAETGEVEAHARAKLEAKGADLVAANEVGGAAPGGFERDENALFVCWRGGECHLPLASKTEIAHRLIRLIAERYYAENTDQDP
ncbi:bifunctional phosphopantothenoylcysteine decarboxylase/phosphopantothenate--cysteine ligase CoaBC [Methylococcus geothermalis]|uniref:Coenzyme A biosynthesis bifunctional protein CoaBC n=1 Tax=Methylococcus geothermalis TaxID=2681310 RepID=A0A858Q458_9GAMM|nr:bifunctional phosphopantothenoylcysteine decarboxylase/phosphopantothenate--cysteine ligase CoaBC [Methylococcus geothermalis]